MKKIFSIFTIFAIFISSFSFVAFAQENNTVYSFDFAEGKSFYYHKDINGEPYIIENGKKYSVAIPDYVEKVTDESLLSMLRNEANKNSMSTFSESGVLFSDTVYFNTLVKTQTFNITDNYLFLKCSKLNPSNAKRGFSYWILYSFDKTEWLRAFYANKSLTFYTRHPMATFGNAPYVIIHIYSYYGSVSSCTLSIKQGGVLG